MVLRAGCVIEPRPYDSGAHPAAYGTQQRPSSAIGNWVFAVPTLQGLANVEVPPGFEPGNKGFADLRLTAWLWHRVWSGRRDSDSRHPPWQGGTLPLSYYRTLWCLGAELNHRHVDFQSTALPTELPRQMATKKGLEPSTSSVTGWHSNQLNYLAI